MHYNIHDEICKNSDAVRVLDSMLRFSALESLQFVILIMIILWLQFLYRNCCIANVQFPSRANWIGIIVLVVSKEEVVSGYINEMYVVEMSTIIETL